MAAAAVPSPRFSPLARARIVIRLAAMAAWLLVCVPLHYVWRHGLRWLGVARSPWPRRFLGGLCWLAGVEVRIVGRRPAKGTFLLANHVSWIDIPALAGATGTAFVAHDGLAEVSLLRWLCAMNDTVFIARHDRASVHRQVAQVREAIRDTGALTIFPEGTTGDGLGLLPFKSSLLSAFYPPPEGIAIQPVLLDYGPEAAGIAWAGVGRAGANVLRSIAPASSPGSTTSCESWRMRKGSCSRCTFCLP
jgi:1-acyl-sn-glycerol-3-phosphate acyltransferase